LIGASINEFSTDVTMSQNSDTKVSTQKAVKTYVDTLDGITPVGGTFTVAGISTVSGTTQFTKQLNVSGVSTFHGNVNLLDGDRLRLGSSEDLQLYHDSNNSYISENGTGDLKIQASAGSIFLQKSNGEEMIKATVDGPVELYHDDGLKITTTKTGAVITGICTATDFSGPSAGAADFPNGLTGTTGTFSGNVSIGGVLTYEDVTNVDSIGIVTARTGLVSPYANIDDWIDVGSNIRLGNAGIITATSYRGDGSQLTGIDATSLKDSSGNVRAQANSGDVSITAGIDLKVSGPHSGANNSTAFNSMTGRLVFNNDHSDQQRGPNKIVMYNQGSFIGGFGISSSTVDFYSGEHFEFSRMTGNTTIVPLLVLKNTGNLEPGQDAIQNLGTSTKRWANIYSADLQLSNKGGKNDVDGTWGDFTIQEGEHDLFLINKRNGKKYKFNLTEVN